MNMSRKCQQLWDLHSHVASYVMPTKRLCLTLLQRPVSKAAILKQLASIKAHPKLRKDKDYYDFGQAFIKAHPADIKLNPLHANLHHRMVRQADLFLQQIKELNCTDEARFDVAKATAIAKVCLPEFKHCTLQQLKTEVEAACTLIEIKRAGRGAVAVQVAPNRRGPAKSPTPPDVAHSTVTVSQLTKEWKCGRDKIYALIDNGDLQATDISVGKGLRRRFLITRQDAEECRKKRAVRPADKEPSSGRRPKKSAGIKQYF
jgi:hypothetical protein